MNLSPNILQQVAASFGTAKWDQLQIIRQPFYDTISYPTTGQITDLVFFSVPQGGADPNGGRFKTSEQTNITKPSSFGQQYFAINAIRTDLRFSPKARQPAAISGDNNYIYAGLSGDAGGVPGGATKQIRNLANRGILVVSFGQKMYCQIERPFVMAPYANGFDVKNFASVKPATDYPFGSWFWQSDPDIESLYILDPPILVEPEMAIDCRFQMPDVGTFAAPVFTNTVPTNEPITVRSTPNVDMTVMFDGYLIRPQQ